MFDNGYPQRAGDYVCRKCFDENGLDRVHENWNPEINDWDEEPLPLL